MAHRIEERDQMVSVGERPWHGLGILLDAAEHLTTEQAVEKCGMDWEVETIPVTTADGYTLEGYAAIRRKDIPEEPFSLVSDTYTPVQNREVFSIGDSLIGDGVARVETMGSLRNNRVIWALWRLKDAGSVLKGDDIERFLLASSSHDGTRAVIWKPTNVRVVCDNTLTLSDAFNSNATYKFLHTTNVKAAMEEGKQFVKWAVEASDRTIEQYREMTRKQLNEAAMAGYFKAVFPDKLRPANDRELARIERDTPYLLPSVKLHGIDDLQPILDRNKCMELVESGAGTDIAGVRGTVWGAYNAVTEYVDRNTESSVKDAGNRLYRTWFGSAAKVKNVAFDKAMALLN
jgi:phage/plasmid-like protein (TIGR03299 family)